MNVDARRREIARYPAAYGKPGYHMKGQRRADAFAQLAALPCRGAYLDVGCGRGEALCEAASLGFAPVVGTEVVPCLIGGDVVGAEAHALPFPDRAFDVATMFDVIEHLIPGDDEAACRELARVARRHVLVTANNRASMLNGTDLHINKRPFEEWDVLFRGWFPGRVMRVREVSYWSQMWRVDFG